MRNVLSYAPYLIIAGLFSRYGIAQADDAPEIKPERIVVVATRSERPVSDVAAGVAVISSEELRERMVSTFEDLVRYQPGVQIDQAGTRFGATSLSVRGIGENRVAMLLDGVPLADQFDVGNYANAGRDVLELGLLNRVEILRGPASTLYGSDAVGGVVSMQTLRPDDLLRQTTGSVLLRTSYDGRDDGRSLMIAGALGNEQQQLLLAGARRDSQAFGHSAVTAIDDGREQQRQSLLLHWQWQIGVDDALRVIAEQSDNRVESDNRSLLGYARFASTTALFGDDDSARQRLLVHWRHDGSDWDIDINVFQQQQDSNQYSDERRQTASSQTRIERNFAYQFDHTGVDSHFSRALSAFGVEHRIGVGASFGETEIREQRDGLQTNLLTGVSTTTILGERMPVRDFPLSDIHERAVYAHDEIRLSSNWELIPGWRYEHYELSPQVDALWREDNPLTDVTDIDTSAHTGKLALLHYLSAMQTLYLQYAEGFRSPPFEDANIGLYLPAFRIRAIPNPDLKPESSRTIEFGWRGRAEQVEWAFALFQTRFDDFIESRVNLGLDPGSGDTLFQSQNVRSATIEGAELEAQWQWTSGDWGELLSQAALFYGKGENEQTGEPLNSVPPFNGHLGLQWQKSDWQLSLISRFAEKQTDVDQSRHEKFVPAGYAVFDLLWQWQPTDEMQLGIGIYNLADKTWWQWNDVSIFEAGHPMIPLLSQPGRYAKLQWQMTF